MGKHKLFPMEKSACAPKFKPEAWCGEARLSCNCLDYAGGDNRPKRQPSQPGGTARLPKKMLDRLDVQQLIFCAERDGLKRAFGPVALAGHYLVALAFESRMNKRGYPADYHWYLENDDGTWSHKFLLSAPLREDGKGRVITDPRTCDRGSYDGALLVFFHVPEGGLEFAPCCDPSAERFPKRTLQLPHPRFR